MDKEPPRFWIAFSILCITFALCFVMLVYNSVQAHAQQPPPCARMETIVKGMLEQFHERKIWQGIKSTAQGPTETFLFQSQDGKTWTQVDVVGKDENGKPSAALSASVRTAIRMTWARASECPSPLSVTRRRLKR